MAIGYETVDDLDISSTAIAPSVNYMVLKQGEDDMPISVNINAIYQYNTFSDLDVTSNTVGFGLGIFHRLEASDNVSIIPGANIGWSKTTFNESGFLDSPSNSNVGFTIHGSALFNEKFYITPILSFSDGNSSFGLRFGAIFPN